MGTGTEADMAIVGPLHYEEENEVKTTRVTHTNPESIARDEDCRRRVINEMLETLPGEMTESEIHHVE